MSVPIEEYRRPEFVLPAVETNVFDMDPDAHIWVGKVAVGNLVLMPAEAKAFHQLRANVYIDEAGFLPEASRSEDGGEYDADDLRSTHFVVVENRQETKRVVGGVRLIEKRDEEDLLPAERYFPEAFTTKPAEVGSVEISRLISRNPNQALQSLVSLASIRAIDLHAVANNVPNSYAVVERPMQKWLRIIGVPNEPLAEYKPLGDYAGTSNTVVSINPREVLESALNATGRRAVLRQFYESALQEQGLGYYSPLDQAA